MGIRRDCYIGSPPCDFRNTSNSPSGGLGSRFVVFLAVVLAIRLRKDQRRKRGALRLSAAVNRLQYLFLFLYGNTNALKGFSDTAVRADKSFAILPAECGSALVRLSAFWADIGHRIMSHCFSVSFFENAYACASVSWLKPKSVYPWLQVLTYI